MCGIRGRGTVLLLAGSALEKCPGLSQISKACVPELLLNTSKVESTVCNCVCVLLCGAPADLLLLFLPPGPKADRLSKHSLPQQWTDSLLDTCILGTEFFFFCCWISYYRMPENVLVVVFFTKVLPRMWQEAENDKVWQMILQWPLIKSHINL